MSTAIVVSVISAAVALVSVFVSARATRKATWLAHQLKVEESRRSKEEEVEDLMSRYREPLLRAAFDLQSRIYNIIRRRFLVRYGAEGRDHERDYAKDNTLFLFAEYLSWVEIMRRDVQFLDLGDVERNRLLVSRLDSIAETFSSDRSIKDKTFRIFRGDQRALGELVIVAGDGGPDDGSGRRQCLGYAEFRARLRDDPAFAEWFRPLTTDIAALTRDDDHDYERLTKLQHALIDLIAFLDDPPRRFLPEFRTRL